jgi:dimethylargininase
MAKESRRGEQLEVARILEGYMPIKWAEAPATMEGGDVIHFPDRLICGLTQRTNRDGIAQMKDWLRVHVDIIEDTSIMHLKSYITSLGKSKVITTKKYFGHQAIEDLKKILVPEIEEFAADTLTIGDTVIMPTGYPRSHELVRKEGYEVITLDISEIEKCDGAITCLSILF